MAILQRRRWIGSWLAAFLQVSPETLAVGKELEFERISIDQGLAHSSVLAVTQDRRGFLWLATRGGLDRFDGHAFEVFRQRPGKSGSLSNDSVYAIFEDSSGVLWVGTFGGLDRFDPYTRQFHHIRHDPAVPNSLSHPHVTAIEGSETPALWIGTRRGLHRLDPASGRLTRYLHDPNNPNSLGNDDVRALAHDGRSALWIGTTGGLFRLDSRSGDFVKLDGASVGALLLDRSGRLWIGTVRGLARFDATTGRVVHLELSRGATEPDVRALYRDVFGRLWLGTDGDGLVVFDPASNDIQSYRHDPTNPKSLSSNRVSALVEDATGVLWIATLGGGLSKLVSKVKRPEHRRFGDGPVRALVTDRAGSVWVGFESDLRRFDRQSWESLPVEPEELSGIPVTALCQDRGEDLWIGTRGAGLGRLEAATGHWLRYVSDAHATSLSHDTVTVLLADSSGTLWVGTRHGLNRFLNDTRQFVRYKHDPADPVSLSNDLVHAIHEDRMGWIWVGTYVGLNRLDADTGRSKRFLRDPDDPGSLSDSRIWSIYTDALDRLWIGTSGGLHLFDPVTERFTRYTRGVGRDTIYGIVGDGRGALWLSTDSEMLKFDPTTGHFVDHLPTLGLASGEFNPKVFHQSADGEIFLASGDGFVHFHPEQILKTRRRAPVVLTGFRKLDQDVVFESLLSEVEEITLSHRDHLVAFELALLDYADPLSHHFSYKLENWNDAWIQNGPRRQVTLGRLAAGEYIFRARGSTSGGDWSDQELALRVVVTPPFWETVWFRSVAVATLVILGLVAYDLRMRSVRKRSRQLKEHNAHLREEIQRRKLTEKEKEKIIEELELSKAEVERLVYAISHDLKNPLTTIGVFLGKLEKDTLSGDGGRAASDVERIRTAVRRMGSLFEQLLEICRIGRVVNAPESVALDELVRAAVDAVKDQVVERGVDVVISPGLPIVWCDRSRLLEVLQILLDNAVKFMGDQGTARVEVGQRRGPDNERVFYVRDNGVGIDPIYHEKVFGLFDRLDAGGEGTGVGLAIAKRVIELHDGRIWVESEGPGQGTTVCFTLQESDDECLPNRLRK